MNQESFDKIPFQSATEILEGIHSGKFSTEEVVLSFLARIKKYNSVINAITDMRNEEEILDEAREKDKLLKQGIRLGALHGLPMTVKDCFHVKGLITSNANPSYRNYVAVEDAELVKRLKSSGAIIMGKTNLPLFSIDWQSTNSWFGQTNNPYDISRVPGGSSGGSAAAIAMGFAAMELGSDAGGSIRVPAHFCGICGIRTTEQALPNRGQFKLPGKAQGHRLITVAGPMAKNVQDLLLAMNILWNNEKLLSEIPPVHFNSSSWNGDKLKIAYSSTMYNLEIDSEYKTIIDDFLRKLQQDGNLIKEDKPIYNCDLAYELNGIFLGHEIEASSPAPTFWTALFFFFFILIKYGDYAWAKGTWKGIGINAGNLLKALEQKDEIADNFTNFFNQYDIWITPVGSIPAFKHQRAGKPFMVNGKRVSYTNALGRFNFDTSIPGHPIVVIPIGQTREGLPVGISIHGKKWTDRKLLEIARYFEGFTEGFKRPKMWNF